MDEEAAPQKRPLPKPLLFFGLFVLVFTVLPTVQTLAAGFLLGFDSDLFVTRLWSTAFLWLAPVSVVLIMAPLLAPLGRKILTRVRLVSAPITALATALLIWLGATDKMPAAVLAMGIFIALTPWISTFVLERMGAKKTLQSRR